MKKPLVIGRFIKIVTYSFRKKLILRITNFIDSKNPIQNYTVTEDDIDLAGDVMDKLFKMIESCKYFEQLEVADKYVNQYEKSFPFAIILVQILRRKILKKMKTTEFYDLDWDKNIETILFERNKEIQNIIQNRLNSNNNPIKATILNIN